MMSRPVLIKFVLMCLILLMILSACDYLGDQDTDLSVEEQAQTMVAMTLESEHNVQTIVAATIGASRQGGDTTPPTPERDTPQSSIPTETPSPTFAVTATVTLTPTPEVPTISVSMDTNCRKGPGTVYDYIGALLVGETAEVVGASMDGEYWIIKNPDRAGECWLWGRYATVTGPTEALPKYTPPPTPTPIATATPTVTATPEYNWTGTWTTSFGMPSMMHETIAFTLTQTGSTVSGSFTHGPDIVTLSGSLSADKRTLTGTWTSLPSSGPFAFYLVSANQFRGNKDSSTYEWCGYRAGAGLPSPCMGP